MRIKKLYEEAIVPTKGTAYSAGWDLYNSKDDIMMLGKDSYKVSTGIAMEIPIGYVGLVFARSGLACKHGLRPANCVGVIDSDYRGEIIVCLKNDEEIPYLIRHGERVAQIVIVPYAVIDSLEVVDELNSTARGEGRFGSTGR